MRQLSYRKWFALCLGAIVSCLCASSLWAATVYVSPEGRTPEEGGDGTLANPYDLQSALTKRDGYDPNLCEFRLLMSDAHYIVTTSISPQNKKFLGWNGETDSPAGREGRDKVVLDGQGATLIVSSGNLNGNWTFADLTFRDGYSTSDGACLYALNVTGNNLVTNCVFTGGVYGYTVVKVNAYRATDVMKFVDCDFTATTNNAWYGILNIQNNILFESCRFTDNVSTQAGNGYGSIGYGSATFTDCVFTNNSLTAHGGLCLSKGVFKRCRFEDNTSKGDGCCIQPSSGTATIVLNDCQFNRNYSKGTGGCISGGTISGTSSCGNIFATNCVFTGNASGSTGGAIGMSSGSATAAESVVLVDCAFTNNVSASYGGAICLGNIVDLEIDRCSFVDNVSTGHNAAVRLTDDKLKLTNGVVRNSLFLRNSGVGDYKGGSAAAVQMPDHTFVDNCTFVSNICLKGIYGALNLSGTNEPRIKNCIFWENRSTYAASHREGQFQVASTGDEKYWNCCSEYGFLDAAHGNLNGTSKAPLDPMFTDIAADNWSLQKKSPCIDAGLDAPWMVGARDIRNQRKIPRIVGDAVDMGCYEYRPDPGLLLWVR